MPTPDPRPAVSAGAPTPDIYLVAAHPDWRGSRVNRRLHETANSVPRVTVRDLYGDYADYHIDIAREQAACAAASLIVLLQPVYWYSMPALLKLWVDEVLAYGWAYGAGGTALHGKDLWLVASTGGSQAAYHPQGYNRYFFDAFLPPYEQTAALCGMRFLPPLVLHGAHSVGAKDLDEHTDTFGQLLNSYPAWPELDELDVCVPRFVPAIDRGEDDTQEARADQPSKEA